MQRDVDWAATGGERRELAALRAGDALVERYQGSLLRVAVEGYLESEAVP